MQPPSQEQTPELTALLVAPDRDLAARFKETLEVSKAFQILADLKSYPSRQALEIRLRQICPDLVLVDLASDREQAAGLIRFLVESSTPVQIVGLSPGNDPGVLLNCLRLGASEFLYAPFDIATQLEAVSRLRRIRRVEPAQEAPQGQVAVFSSVKPGSGSTTISFQAAVALRRTTGKRVLLADFDLAGGSAGFYSKLERKDCVFGPFAEPAGLTPNGWPELVSNWNGVDVLMAPAAPLTEPVSPAALHAVLEFARLRYDWVLIDVPAVFDRWSLAVLSQADRALLVTTAELPSLHLARKAIRYLHRLGFPPDRFQVLINRVNRRHEISAAHLERIFECSVHSGLPDDFFALHRLAGLGEPLDEGSELGSAVQRLATGLATGLATKLSGAPANANAAMARARA
jgi:pilus assembly protein CpaE